MVGGGGVGGEGVWKLDVHVIKTSLCKEERSFILGDGEVNSDIQNKFATWVDWLRSAYFLHSLHSTSQLDRNIKGQMIKDLLNLAGFYIPENLITTSTSRWVTPNLKIISSTLTYMYCQYLELFTSLSL